MRTYVCGATILLINANMILVDNPSIAGPGVNQHGYGLVPKLYVGYNEGIVLLESKLPGTQLRPPRYARSSVHNLPDGDIVVGDCQWISVSITRSMAVSNRSRNREARKAEKT